MSIESAGPSSSVKRLRPKQSPTSRPAPPLPPDPDADQLLSPLKKTRDFPNFSDCHACNTRVNNTNPQDRLLLLDSVWRIILLCRKCIKRVQFQQTCSYCYKECGVEDCVTCLDCQRGIHRDCVLRYGDGSPWLLCKRELGLGLDGVFVCVDCWVPRVLKKSVRVVKRKKLAKGPGVGGLTSRVRFDVSSDGHCSTGREAVLALMAPCGSSRKALELGNGVVGCKGGDKVEGLCKSGSVNGVICYKRQRVVKSGDSERRDSGVHETRHFPITYKKRKKKLEWRTYERGNLKRKIFLENIKDRSSAEVVGPSGPSSYERGSLKREVFLENIKDGSSAEVDGTSGPCLYRRGSVKRKVFLENIKDGSSAEVDGTSGPCSYRRGSSKRKIFLENIKDGSSAEVDGKNGPYPNSRRNTEIPFSGEGNLNKLEHIENKCSNLIECDSDTSMKGVAEIEKFDRCLLTYSKRRAIHKSPLSG